MQTPVRRLRLPGVYQEHIPHRRPPAMLMGSDLSYNIIIIVNVFACFVKGDSAIFLPFCKILFQSCFFLPVFPVGSTDLYMHRKHLNSVSGHFSCQNPHPDIKNGVDFRVILQIATAILWKYLQKRRSSGIIKASENTNSCKGEDYNGTDRT